eukprot:CAMPEP_0194568352 /NCGR_PEP_ID=MMETSP0292-20121207/6521_1 /TAXON_ID=39354 /ORGANISM="Heterosigma akashiwo, Strain CCMP2393" /LENGTH=136 /DNA_ID=CAMNT_0039418423 /DNA_START=697 /DNA_END=1103 /DNA_ORIENTATION=+
MVFIYNIFEGTKHLDKPDGNLLERLIVRFIPPYFVVVAFAVLVIKWNELDFHAVTERHLGFFVHEDASSDGTEYDIRTLVGRAVFFFGLLLRQQSHFCLEVALKILFSFKMLLDRKRTGGAFAAAFQASFHGYDAA